jgi:hypothetical protein
MPACKACGEWFAKTNPHEELCFKCECALSRLSSYVARVVRCKDCKYNRGSKKCLNPDSFFAVPKDDDFCSYGERKEGGAE